MAYLLISSASAAIPVTNQMREGLDNIFTDSSAAAISMSFLAFLSLALDSKPQISKFDSHMSNPDEPTKNNHAGSPVPAETPTADVENPTPAAGFGVSAITRRWKREDLLKRGSLVARGLALLFSLLSFIIMASNKHGDRKNFDNYEEYRYLLAIAILSTLYTGVQALRHVHEISTGKQIFERRISAMVDFLGDQVVAYLLISSASAAIPMTNRMREGQDNIFTDSSASAISMSVFAFLSLALSAMVSGYNLSTQSYI
ncbi:Casparian strip membrane protein domain - like 10 [Theobroma cacao]|nr:Casparian strip membrane protein domain - like 10 [Theobroma cacao]